MVRSTEETSLWLGFLILHEWRSTNLARPRRAEKRSVVLYSTSTANKCFIALFTQWNLFHYFYKKKGKSSQPNKGTYEMQSVSAELSLTSDREELHVKRTRKKTPAPQDLG